MAFGVQDMGLVAVPTMMLNRCCHDDIACRHEDYWPRWSEWLPERWLPENAPSLGQKHTHAFMPFAVGARSCIGRYFAVLELQVLLALLLRKVHILPVDSFEVELSQSFTLKSKSGMLVNAAARQ